MATSTAKPTRSTIHDTMEYGASDVRSIHHGFITTRFLVVDKKPLITSDHGKTVGQLVDDHLNVHRERIMEARQALINEGRDPNDCDMGPISSITLDLPTEE